MENTNLHAIGLKHKAEKTTLQCRTQQHNYSYLDVYDKLFSDNLDISAELNILEIGTRYGGSVKMWLEYFPNSHVYGFDNLSDSSAQDLSDVDDRFTFVKGDQTNPEDLEKLTDLCSKFDVIVDDACHIITSFVFTFNYLIDFLSVDGLYCIEDLYNNYGFWNAKENRPTVVNRDGEEFDAFIAALTKEIHKSTLIEYGCPISRIFSIQTFPGLLVIKKTF